MNKKQQEVQRREEYLALTRGLLWVAAAIVIEVLLILVNRYAFHYTTAEASINLAIALRSAFKVVRILGLVAFVGGLGVALVQQKKGGKSVWYVVASILGLVLTVCAHVLATYQESGLRMLFLLVPVLGGLALAYYIYQREFFLPALACVLSALGLWFIRSAGLSLEAILALAAGAVLVLAVLVLKKNRGVLKAAGLELRLIPEKADYKLALGASVVALCAQLVALAAGAVIAYYLIFAMGALLFALLVYYTVKMM